MLHRLEGEGLDSLKKQDLNDSNGQVLGRFDFILFFNLTLYYLSHILKLSELDENRFSWCLIGLFSQSFCHSFL